jgi:hypothetical protein
MKIGYLLQAGVPDIRQSPLTGPANHVKQIIQELRNMGHQVCLLACLDNKIWKSDDLEEFIEVPVLWMDKGPLRLIERIFRRIQFTLKLPYAALFDSERFAQACKQGLADYDIFYERIQKNENTYSIGSKW